MTEKQTNPVRHINYWVKGEVLGLDSLIAAINYKDSIDGLKKSARPWHCSVHQFIAPDWNICRKENCIDITTNEQIVCATMA